MKLVEKDFITTPCNATELNIDFGNEMTEKMLAPILELFRKELFQFCKQHFGDTGLYKPHGTDGPYWEKVAWGFWKEVIIGGFLLQGDYKFGRKKIDDRPLTPYEIISGCDFRGGSFHERYCAKSIMRDLLYLGERFGGSYHDDAIFLVGLQNIINPIYTWMNNTDSPIRKGKKLFYSWSHIIKAFTQVEQNVKFLGIDQIRYNFNEQMEQELK